MLGENPPSFPLLKVSARDFGDGTDGSKVRLCAFAACLL